MFCAPSPVADMLVPGRRTYFGFHLNLPSLLRALHSSTSRRSIVRSALDVILVSFVRAKFSPPSNVINILS